MPLYLAEHAVPGNQVTDWVYFSLDCASYRSRAQEREEYHFSKCLVSITSYQVGLFRRLGTGKASVWTLIAIILLCSVNLAQAN